jgi:hypothetical protein
MVSCGPNLNGSEKKRNLAMENQQAARVNSVEKAIGRYEVIPGVSRPKAMLLLAAGLSFFMSVYIFFSGDHERGIFVGIWVPSILSAGSLLLGRDRNE